MIWCTGYNPGRVTPPVSAASLVTAAIVFAAIAGVALANLRAHHPFPGIGAANQVTFVRALLAAAVAGLTAEPAEPQVAVAAIACGAVCSVLDGVDGWLARRSGTTSAFGARFDMEVDAILILALSIIVWRQGKAGAWVLASGLLRYVFLGAGALFERLRGPLPPTNRARVICVVQVAALLVALLPGVDPPASALIAAAALAALAYSFVVDTIRLWRQASPG